MRYVQKLQVRIAQRSLRKDRADEKSNNVSMNGDLIYIQYLENRCDHFRQSEAILPSQAHP